MIFTRLISMPVTIKGCTTLDGNGDFNIFINSNISFYEQLKAYEHEMKHITGKHFELESAEEAEKRV